MNYYDSQDDLVTEIVKARTTLLYQQPLLGEIGLQTDIVILDESDWCERAATDGRAIYFNRSFIISLFFDADTRQTRLNGHYRLVAVLAHEIWHILLNHLTRRGNRDRDYWAMAIDYAVNAIIQHDKMGLLPAMALTDKRFTIDHSVYEIYDYLVANNVPKQPSLDEHIEAHIPTFGGGEEDGDGDSGVASPDEPYGAGDIRTMKGMARPAAPTAAESKARELEVKMTAIRAVQEGTAGSLPAGLAREIDDIVNNDMDWRTLLDSKLRSIHPCDYTYDELSDITWASWFYHRRKWTPESKERKGYCAILPTQTDGEKAEVYVGLDTSASLSSTMIGLLLAHIGNIFQTYDEFEVTILCFDGKVGSETKFTKANMREFGEFKTKRVVGGGGTNFMSVFDYLKAKKIKPDRLVIATDGLPNGSWGDPNYCDTIFLVHDEKKSRKAPFGLTAFLD